MKSYPGLPSYSRELLLSCWFALEEERSKAKSTAEGAGAPGRRLPSMADSGRCPTQTACAPYTSPLFDPERR